jgi:hypothetical protein
MFRTPIPAVLATALAVVSCSEHDAQPTAPVESPSSVVTPATDVSAETRTLEGLARRLAMALRNPAFRAEVKARLDGSPFPEHKIHLQRFLAEHGRSAARALATESHEPEAVTDSVARSTRALEVYLPVPEHRRRWTGDERLLVATQARDGEIPVAFDLNGGRHFLDPTHPPDTPVLAAVPVETDFDHPPGPAGVTCLPPSCGSGGSGAASPPGLYMTKASINGDFEGWLKGDPEYEIHILGQLGASDSLTDYQCAGEHAGGYSTYDQNGSTWTGKVLLFSQTQIDGYKAAHPGMALRIVALEDDDTACQIKIDQNRWSSMVAAFKPTYNDFTGAIDNGTVPNWIKAAKSVLNLLSKVASWIKSNDDLIGNAIEDKTAGQYNTGYNWVVKDGTTTNGWLNLEMR